MKNEIIKSKLSINRSLNQLSHIQAMFLFCEPRNMGMDADIADNVIDLISKVRRELRIAQQELETAMDRAESDCDKFSDYDSESMQQAAA